MILRQLIFQVCFAGFCLAYLGALPKAAMALKNPLNLF
jgi:hypothetical protein